MIPTQRISLVQNLKEKKEKNSPAVNKVPVHGNEQSSASWTTVNGNINAIPVPVVNESKPRMRLRSKEQETPRMGSRQMPELKQLAFNCPD